MNWNCLAIAAALTHLLRRRALQKQRHNACGSSSPGCACYPQTAAKRHGVRNAN
jgi:hypothetical protein